MVNPLPAERATAERATAERAPADCAPAEAAALPRLGRCAVMGVLNVTSDSFSDGGRYLDPAAAIAHGQTLRAQGADIIDVGGESTRPGATRVDGASEAERICPVIRGLAAEGAVLSVDTMRASVAAAAIEAGAAIVNDVSGGLADPDMARVVAEAGCPWILMHWVSADEYSSGAAGRLRSDAAGADGQVVEVVREHLARRAEAAVAAGVDPSRIVLDPGLGFAKDADENWALLHGLPRLQDLGFPVLVAASRKRFLGSLLAGVPAPVPGAAPSIPDRSAAEPRSVIEPRATIERDRATDAISAIAAAHGVWGVRVHDVPGTVDAVKVAQAWRAGRAVH